MKISQIDIPTSSLINKSLPVNHYADCFSCEFRSKETVLLESIARSFLNYNPGWVKCLVVLRNILVKPFNLQTGTEKSAIITISKGSKASIFKVLEMNDDELLLYYEDKHLDACFSIMLNRLHHQNEITASTTVYFHNNLGRIYFFFIKPFHILIIKSMLIRVTNNFLLTN